MSYVERTLSQVNDNSYYLPKAESVLLQSKLSVLLGSPGSGKTTLLKNIEGTIDSVQFLTVKQFLKNPDRVHEQNTYLLLDGLDEYRSLETDKTGVMDDVAYQVSLLGIKKVIISCRDLEWYGEHDQDSLKDVLGTDVQVYRLELLSVAQQQELAVILEAPNNFIVKYSHLGLLGNPFIFKMLVEVCKDNKNELSTKKDIYQAFILHSKESNPEHTINTPTVLDEVKFYKNAGYLACFYLFSKVDVFDGTFLEQIENKSNGFSKQNLKEVVATKLFDSEMFIHRTLAEFLVAHFMTHNCLDDQILGFERVQNLFVHEKKVASELRGAFSWLCCLTQNSKFISIDPYHQLLYGDNSMFSLEAKKDIIRSIKSLAIEEPFFCKYADIKSLEGFFNSEIETFLVDEFFNPSLLNNNYQYFISAILANTLASDLESDTLFKLKKFLLNPEHNNTLKINTIRVFKEDVSFLTELAEKIQTKKVPDINDVLKDWLLDVLYLKEIQVNKIAPYLMSYSKEVFGHCRYLYKTPFEDKLRLIESIYSLHNKTTTSKSLINTFYNVEEFIDDYCLETVLKYPEDIDEKGVYRILSSLVSYLPKFEKIKYTTCRPELEKLLNQKNSVLSELTPKLFKEYVRDELKGDKQFWNFKYLFDLKELEQQKQVEVYLELMNKSLSDERNLTLFKEALLSDKVDEEGSLVNLCRFNKIADMFSLNDTLTEYKSRHIKGLALVNDCVQKRTEDRDLSSLLQKEHYFKNQSDQDIFNDFEVLKFIAGLIYTRRSKPKVITDETFIRLKKVLANVVQNPSQYSRLMTIKSLATKKPLDGKIGIIGVMYCSLALNSHEKEFLPEASIQNYLYLNAVLYEGNVSIIPTNYPNFFEQRYPEKSMHNLLDYIKQLLIFQEFKYTEDIFTYLRQEKSIKVVKSLAKINVSSTDFCSDFILEVVRKYHFGIADSVLRNLATVSDEISSLVNAILSINGSDLESSLCKEKISPLSSVFYNNYPCYMELNNDLQTKILVSFMKVFSNLKDRCFKNGFISSADEIVYFIDDVIVKQNKAYLLEEVQRELESSGNSNIWINIIKHRLVEIKQQNSDIAYKGYDIEPLKSFLLTNKPMDHSDFFYYVVSKIEALIIVIEDNRNNEKEAFWNHKIYKRNGKKTENQCRDFFMTRLNDRHNELELSREKHEAENRVDINVKSNFNSDFEVQIECKRDCNTDLKTGIKDQLIDKYFSSGVMHGIYLIFYFGKCTTKNKENLLKELTDRIPREYSEKIKVLILDLT